MELVGRAFGALWDEKPIETRELGIGEKKEGSWKIKLTFGIKRGMQVVQPIRKSIATMVIFFCQMNSQRSEWSGF